MKNFVFRIAKNIFIHFSLLICCLSFVYGSASNNAAHTYRNSRNAVATVKCSDIAVPTVDYTTVELSSTQSIRFTCYATRFSFHALLPSVLCTVPLSVATSTSAAEYFFYSVLHNKYIQITNSLQTLG